MEAKSLKELRIEKGLTLQKMSSISGINIARLSIIERGVESPNTLTRLILEQIFNQPIKWIDATDKKVRYINPQPIRTK